MIGVADTSPISALSRIGKVDLLAKTFSTLWIPPEVATELDDGRRLIGDWRAAAYSAGIRIQPVRNQTLQQRLAQTLHLGESAAIALASEIPATILVIDELEGRQAARRLGLTVTGTLGLVVSAKRRGVLPAARPVIEQLRQRGGLWLSEAIVQHALTLAEED